MKYQVTKNNSGFTMVETLVAIFILLISITGPLVVAQNGLKAAFIARDQTTAYYLAQDALEFIKNTRDTNFIKGSPWLQDLDQCADGNICSIDTTDLIGGDSIKSCLSANIGCDADNPLKYSSTEKTFGFDGDQDSKYYRNISIERVNSVGDDYEAKVTVTVGWTTQDGTNRTVKSIENIFKWAPIYD